MTCLSGFINDFGLESGDVDEGCGDQWSSADICAGTSVVCEIYSDSDINGLVNRFADDNMIAGVMDCEEGS